MALPRGHHRRGVARAPHFRVPLAEPEARLKFGPADLGRNVSLLTKLAHFGPSYNVQSGDVITQSVP